MTNTENTVVTAEEEFEALIPDGWTGAEGADFFDPSTWGVDDTDADAQTGDDADGDGNFAGEDDGQTRTTGEDDDSMTEGEDNTDPTTVGKKTADNKLRFRAIIDHRDEDVELDPADLPGIYQKARALERYQKRASDMEAELAEWDAVAAGLKYSDRKTMRESVVENAINAYLEEHPNVPEDMARDYITRQFKRSDKPAETKSENTSAPTRDFKQEVADLYQTYPQARTEKLPTEVVNETIRSGKPLVQTYAEYLARKATADAKSVQKENKILKQNQASAAKAPVSKVTGGGKTDTSPTDDFLAGFNSDSW